MGMDKIRITQLDLFSGIGGFHLGFERAGYEVETYFSEIDKYAIDVYQNNFKNSKYVGSVTDVYGRDLPRIDLITFGSPCQDFSLAGKRKGMQGNRSSLISEAIRLISECRPNLFVWENVKGTFSSNNGEDFWAIIQAFANIGGYRLEWQLLNTKWFLPQNRERIYLVGYSTNTSGGQVFPIGESNGVSDTISKGRQTSACITTSYHKGMNYDNQLIQALIYDDYNSKFRTDGDVGTLTCNIGSKAKRNGQKVLLKDRIRRLTPIECERLQGFPDNWTKYGQSGEISDSQRYKMCGNAVTVDVVQAVAEKCKFVFQ